MEIADKPFSKVLRVRKYVVSLDYMDSPLPECTSLEHVVLDEHPVKFRTALLTFQDEWQNQYLHSYEPLGNGLYVLGARCTPELVLPRRSTVRRKFCRFSIEETIYEEYSIYGETRDRILLAYAEPEKNPQPPPGWKPIADLTLLPNYQELVPFTWWM